MKTAYLRLFFVSCFALTCLFLFWILLYQGRTDTHRGQILFGVAVLVFLPSAQQFFRVRKAVPSRLKIGLLLLTSTVFVYLMVVAVTYHFQTFLLFNPVAGDFAQCPKLIARGFIPKHVNVGDEGLRFYLATRPDARANLLVFHGNAEIACRSDKFSDPLSDLPLNFIFAEYPGYQNDAGELSEKAYLKNALTLDRWVAKEFPTLPIFVMGRSLGTGIATYVASETSPRALVLISPYTSIDELAPHAFPYFPSAWSHLDSFKAFAWAEKVVSPTWIVHGDSDRLIPVTMGEAQSWHFKNLQGFGKIAGAGHNTVIALGSPAWTQIHAFIEKQLGLLE